MRDRIKELRRVPASELVPHPKNWRSHPARQQEALASVMEEVGIAGAVLAREDEGGALHLIDGHLRREQLSDREVPVLVLDVDEKEADLLLATLDPLAGLAEQDDDKLRDLLSSLDRDRIDIAQLAMPQTKLVQFLSTPPEIRQDDPPEAPSKPVTEAGDLWRLGPHRLVCGDCADTKALDRLLGGERAACVFTDPPYGVSIGAKNRMLKEHRPSDGVEKDIAGDDLNAADLTAFLRPCFEALRLGVMADDCTLLVCSPQGGDLMAAMMLSMSEAALPVRHVLIWKKNQPTFSLGRLDYDYAHEPILLTWGKRHKRPLAGTSKTSVWEVDKPRASKLHPTMKPVELYANAYLNHTDEGDIVADIFAGSGTAFVAAEQTGRACRGVEIDPAYCDVIVQRWEELTGGKAERGR